MGRSTDRLDDARVADMLHEAGLRATVGRRQIVQSLAALGHATSEEVFEDVRPTVPGLNISTVYRTLETLADVGLVLHAYLVGPGRTYYLASGGDHAHLVCDSCGQITELAGSALKAFATSITNKDGFELAPSRLAVHGQCAACGRSAGSTHSAGNSNHRSSSKSADTKGSG